MRYVLWLVKFVLFALVLTFAIKNTDAVAVRYFLGYEWRAPLIFVLLVAFCAGAAFGVLSTLGQIFRQRREITLLKRDAASPGPAEVPPLPREAA
jgi:uncharacterized integral membrane protein